MKRLAKADFTAAVCPTEVVMIPALGGAVLVRGMTGLERDAVERSMFSGRGKNMEINLQNVRAKFVVTCACDVETGARLFDDADVDAVGAMPAVIVNTIYLVAQRLSGMSEEAIDGLKKPIGETAEAPTDTAGGSSSSPSPES